MSIINRRDVLAGIGAAALSATSARQALAQAPRRGGVLTVQLNGEQRILNPATRASTGDYIIT